MKTASSFAKEEWRKMLLAEEGNRVFDLVREVFLVQRDAQQVADYLRPIMPLLLRTETPKAFENCIQQWIEADTASKHPVHQMGWTT